MFPTQGGDDKLDSLWRAYRAACPEREPSANFMPDLWRRIDARRKFAFSFQRMMRGFVTVAAAFAIAIGVYVSLPRPAPVSEVNYLEALAEANALDTPENVGPVRLDWNDPRR
ncbi:MAG: hypothetical protein ACLQKA_12320 [Bryobacteraceae bacterium]